ncbi:hypothetical protein CAPTEDRAFT_195652 [Capitella teleta]|uniref:Uncharacterized protein n=1 Tax=Capitella teleta TaxID=283909 RepID=X1ZVB9_CAPTE|nr:hypothetical protein CAPTEDRAFT_195652 [Capitella teleta]|eukprot:ELT88367.1 hypothetical protein CAPTEDRAFT_195652 [Capitella teleta]
MAKTRIFNKGIIVILVVILTLFVLLLELHNADKSPTVPPPAVYFPLRHRDPVIRVLVWTSLMVHRDAQSMSRLTIPMTRCYDEGQLDHRFECTFTRNHDELDTSYAILIRGRYIPKHDMPPKLPHQK